jgi:outer membrane protein
MTIRRCLSLMLAWVLTLGFAMTASPAPAHAQQLKVAIVDFQLALEGINEGKAAQSRLETMFMGKQAEIEQRESNIVAKQKEYEAKAAVLTDAARQELERQLGEMQMEYQQFVMRAQQEMAEAEAQVLAQLVEKLQATAAEVGKAQGYTLILANEAVVYSTATDITTAVVAKYNASHSG